MLKIWSGDWNIALKSQSITKMSWWPEKLRLCALAVKWTSETQDSAPWKKSNKWLWGQMWTVWLPPTQLWFCMEISLYCICGAGLMRGADWAAHPSSQWCHGVHFSQPGLLFFSLTRFFHSCPSCSSLSPAVFSRCHFVLTLSGISPSHSLFRFIFLSLSLTWTSPLSSLASEACFRECRACDAVLFWHAFPPTLFSGLNPLIPRGMSCWHIISSQVRVCVCMWRGGGKQSSLDVTTPLSRLLTCRKICMKTCQSPFWLLSPVWSVVWTFCHNKQDFIKQVWKFWSSASSPKRLPCWLYTTIWKYCSFHETQWRFCSRDKGSVFLWLCWSKGSWVNGNVRLTFWPEGGS